MTAAEGSHRAGRLPEPPHVEGAPGHAPVVRDVVVRPADPATDLDGVEDLCAAAGRRPWTAEMLEPLAERVTLVAVDQDGRILGIAKTHFHLEADGVAPAGHYLGGIVVRPDQRRRGIGAELTRARLAWIAERAPQAHYFANARNTASIRLHQAFGFREVARSPVIHGVPTDRPGEELVLFTVESDGPVRP